MAAFIEQGQEVLHKSKMVKNKTKTVRKRIINKT